MQTILCALPALPIPISYTTIVAAVILLIGLISGAKRGLLKSIFSLLSSIGSIVAAVFITPYVGNFLLQQDFVASMGELGPKIVNIISFLIAWILAYLVLKLIFALINKLFKGDGVLGGINRFFGAIFGIAFALLTVMVITYLINIFAGTGFAQELIDNGNVDAFSKWLYTQNPLDQLLALLSEKVPAIGDFLNQIKTAIPAPAPAPAA